MKLVQHALGTSEGHAYIQVALGEEPDVEPRSSEAAEILFLTPLRVGIFRRVGDVPQSSAIIDSAIYIEPELS